MNEKFLTNLTQLKRAVALEPVERIPFAPCGPAFFPLDGGISLKTATTDFETASKVNLAEHIKYNATCTQADLFNPYMLSTFWLSKVSVPGVDLGDNDLWQMNEAKDFVTQDDYREIVDTGFGLWFSKFKKERLDDVDSKLIPFFQNAGPSAMRFIEAGIPPIVGTLMITPFEYFCGGRSMTSFFMDDLMDEPELTEAVFKKTMDYSLAYYQGFFDMVHPIGAWIGGWRAAPSMISMDLFERWALPYIREYVDLCIKNDVIPILHLDSCWDNALEHFRDFPAKKCIMALDGKTDIFKAKKIVGDRMCIMGDVPPEMLVFGTPDEVAAYCHRLIHEVGPIGFIMSSGCDIPPNANPACVMAMSDAARNFVY